LSCVRLASALFIRRINAEIQIFRSSQREAPLEVITRHKSFTNTFSAVSKRDKILLIDGISRMALPFMWATGIGCLWLIYIPYQDGISISVITSDILLRVGLGGEPHDEHDQRHNDDHWPLRGILHMPRWAERAFALFVRHLREHEPCVSRDVMRPPSLVIRRCSRLHS
jgi:hypothetical protein